MGFNLLDILPGGKADPFFGPTGVFSNPTGAWDNFKNGRTNEVNQEIADQNLAYQRERNKIEDSRYEEETSYNRAFAEDERDYQRMFAEDERDYQRQFAEDEREYNRALQQQLFDREDTALERQASSLSAMGINPLSQQLNGLGAGSPITSSAPSSVSSPSASAPSASVRGGSALQNNFHMQDQGVMPILSSMIGIANTLNGVKTGQYQRDALALQNDKQFLDNLQKANNLGINYHGVFKQNKEGYINDSNKGYQYGFYDDEGKSLFETDSYKSASYSAYRKDRKDSMPNWQYTLDTLGTDDVYNQAEKALTKISNLFDIFSENIFNKDSFNKNPFQSLLNLFF